MRALELFFIMGAPLPFLLTAFGQTITFEDVTEFSYLVRSFYNEYQQI